MFRGMQQVTCLKPTTELGLCFLLSSIVHGGCKKFPNHVYYMGNKMSSRQTLEKSLVLLEEKAKYFCMAREDRIVKREYLKTN